AVSSPIQHAAVAGFEISSEMNEYFEITRNIHQLMGEYTYQSLREIDGVNSTKPEATFYVLADFNSFATELQQLKINTSQKLSEALIVHPYHTAIVGGDSLVLERTDYRARIAFVDYDGSKVYSNYKNQKPKTKTDKKKAQYILKGSVHKSGYSVRVTVQLIEVSSGAYLFSTIFDRTLKDIFAVQQNIAQQVGAALKLSLIHKNPHYSSALAKLDHLGVERLVIARARLNTYTDTSINQAFKDLSALNQRYPKTPEVLGLLAVAYNSLSDTAQQNVPNPKQQSTKAAKEALALDPTNLDALKVLYYHYTDLAHLREQGYIISEQIIRHHPGRKSAWRARLHLMINTMRPCQEIQTFVTSIPQGVFSAHRLSIINYILNVCLQSKPLEGLTSLHINGVNQATMKKAISNNIYLFEIHHDMMFDAVKIRSRRKPTQTILTDYYWLQLASGTHSNAMATAKLIDKQGFWPWLILLYNTLYQLPEAKMPQNDSVFNTKAAQINIMHHMIRTPWTTNRVEVQSMF
ncbi:MAG: hypothetical protein MJK04_21715, partial [Psychrosphaera sp.]|nr:hypothetical protein [Psychrosphaera sp.]